MNPEIRGHSSPSRPPPQQRERETSQRREERTPLLDGERKHFPAERRTPLFPLGRAERRNPLLPPLPPPLPSVRLFLWPSGRICALVDLLTKSVILCWCDSCVSFHWRGQTLFKRKRHSKRMASEEPFEQHT